MLSFSCYWKCACWIVSNTYPGSIFFLKSPSSRIIKCSATFLCLKASNSDWRFAPESHHWLRWGQSRTAADLGCYISLQKIWKDLLVTPWCHCFRGTALLFPEMMLNLANKFEWLGRLDMGGLVICISDTQSCLFRLPLYQPWCVPVALRFSRNSLWASFLELLQRNFLYTSSLSSLSGPEQW